jgi:hypothetical protein
MSGYVFRITGDWGGREIFDRVEDAHARLRAFAAAEGLDVHIHAGGWAGTCCSTAYTRGGDALLDAVAVVRAQRLDEAIN